jgi:hypothetical protein
MNEGTGQSTGRRDLSSDDLQARLADVIKLADEVYRQRVELSRSSSSQREAWEREIKLLARQIDSYELEWRLSRLLFVEGERDSRSYYEGAVHGRRSIKLGSSAVEGYFWAGVNLALYAQARQGLRAVFALLEAKRDLKRASQIAEGYHGAGPLRVLGRLAHKSPRVLGGNAERSRICYERALEIAPTNSVTLVYAAELEIDCRNPKKAAGLLERLMRLPIDPDWEFENIRDKNLARSLLQGLGITQVTTD